MSKKLKKKLCARACKLKLQNIIPRRHIYQSGHFVDMSRCGRLVNQVAIWVGTQVFWVESVFREKGERLINEIKSLD